MKNIVLFTALLFLACCSGKREEFLPVFKGSPRINEPSVTGNRPGTPFLFAVPTSGERPVTWTAANLPEGLAIDSQTGFITGTVKDAGDYTVRITAENKLGKTSRDLVIRIGDQPRVVDKE